MLTADLKARAAVPRPRLRYRIVGPTAERWIEPLAVVCLAAERRTRLESPGILPQECRELSGRHIQPMLAGCKGLAHGPSVNGLAGERPCSIDAPAELYARLSRCRLPRPMPVRWL